MRANPAIYPVATMCRLLDISTSGYYEWRGRKPSARARDDAVLAEMISEIHSMSGDAYEARRNLAAWFD